MFTLCVLLPLCEQFQNITVFQVFCNLLGSPVIPKVTEFSINTGLIKKEVHDIYIPPIDCKYQRVPPIYIGCVHIGKFLHYQVFYDFNVTKVTSSVKSSPPVFIERKVHKIMFLFSNNLILLTLRNSLLLIEKCSTNLLVHQIMIYIGGVICLMICVDCYYLGVIR